MILNVLIISILIIVLIVPTSTNVCNFIGYPCSLNTINASYFTQLDYLHDPDIGDSWLLRNDQASLVSGRLVSGLLIPPDGPSPHCLMIRYTITGNALIRLIVITQSDDYEVRFCYESYDEDGEVKKISVPFSMYSHTRITLDISMSSHENCVFNLESFWIVRDDCYARFKERMTQCPEYIAPKNHQGLTTVTTDSSERTIEMTSLQYNDTANQWNGNVTNLVSNSTNFRDKNSTNKSSQFEDYSSTASLISNWDNVSTTLSLILYKNNLTSEMSSQNKSDYIIKTNNITIQLLEPLNFNETIIKDFNGKTNNSNLNYSGNINEMYPENHGSNDTFLDKFLPIITTESWRSDILESNSTYEITEFLEDNLDSNINKTETMNSSLTLSTSTHFMLNFLQSNSSEVADNITAASVTSTAFSDKVLIEIEEPRNDRQVTLKATFNETAGVQRETESSYIGTVSHVVVTGASINYFTPIFTTEMYKIGVANSSSFTQDTGQDKIMTFVNDSLKYNSTNNNQIIGSSSTPVMTHLDENITSTEYPSSDYPVNVNQFNDQTKFLETTIQPLTVSQKTSTTGIIDITKFATTISPTAKYAYNFTVNETISNETKATTEPISASPPSMEKETFTYERIIEAGKDKIKNDTYQEFNRISTNSYAAYHLNSSELNTVTNSSKAEQISNNFTVPASSFVSNDSITEDFSSIGAIDVNVGNNEQLGFKNLPMINH